MFRYLRLVGTSLTADFVPYWFVGPVGMSISSVILFAFPYESEWLRICSYVAFCITALSFISVVVLAICNCWQVCRRHSGKAYFDKYFRNDGVGAFWAFSQMAWGTLVSFVGHVCVTYGPPGCMIFVYVLWWIDIVLSLLVAWGLIFLVWSDHYGGDSELQLHRDFMRKKIQPVLILPVVPCLVATSAGGVFMMSGPFVEIFDRRGQLLTLFVSLLVWLHAICLVFLITGSCVWSFYVNKFPRKNSAFTMFLLVGPMGQGSFGVQLLAQNFGTFITRTPMTARGGSATEEVLRIAVKTSIAVNGAITGLFLIDAGFFFTAMSVAAVLRRFGDEGGAHIITRFHKGWWALPFPLGTMSLATTEFYRQHNDILHVGAFQVIGAVYGLLSVASAIVCFCFTLVAFFRNLAASTRVTNGTKKRPDGRRAS
ncbi:LAMI_0D08152g1_1 [Lachancea mirantina]|uniref:LAMI_0D08152g1_1 n=1 Tax=Lachancea mirantina TaxID=1230905 RepID=A0A1G4JCT7_9SACH|nr:LAMI_0D08152g1_1 [Lachancea mirantina]